MNTIGHTPYVGNKRQFAGAKRGSEIGEAQPLVSARKFASNDLAVHLAEISDKEEAAWQSLFAASEAMLIEMANRAEEEYHAGLTWALDPETV